MARQGDDWQIPYNFWSQERPKTLQTTHLKEKNWAFNQTTNNIATTEKPTKRAKQNSRQLERAA